MRALHTLIFMTTLGQDHYLPLVHAGLSPFLPPLRPPSSPSWMMTMTSLTLTWTRRRGEQSGKSSEDHPALLHTVRLIFQLQFSIAFHILVDACVRVRVVGL